MCPTAEGLFKSLIMWQREPFVSLVALVRHVVHQWAPLGSGRGFQPKTDATPCFTLYIFPWRDAGTVWCLPLSWISGLSFDSPYIYILLFFCLDILICLSCHFCAEGRSILLTFNSFIAENCEIFVAKTVRVKLFCMALVQQLGDGMCSVLPYGTSICHYA